MEKRYIGIDLHRNRFTSCIRLENGRTYLREWDLKDLARFVKELRAGDEVAVEITGNTRLFHDAVAPHVKRVVVVDTNQFRVISQSVKKTERSGRIHKRGTKLGRTALVQSALIAANYSPYLKRFYEQVKGRRGAGKAIIALARKFLGIIYRTLKNKWVFEDFPNFVLAEES
jgi:hypothetical protein